MPWFLWLFLSPPLIGFWLLPTVFGSVRSLGVALFGAWVLGLAVWAWVGFGDWTASDDEALGAVLIAVAVSLPVYAFTVGALTKGLVLRRQGRPELPVWAANAVVLYAIPGLALGQIFKGV